MTRSFELLKFPSHWNGAVNCDPITFQSDGPACKYPNCQFYPDHGDQGEILCACHEHCQMHCVAPRAKAAFGLWRTIVAPYVNASVSDNWTLQVFGDCRRKMNGLDPERGVGVLHALLLAGDDVVLCKQFLELGVDPELRFIRSDRTSYESLDDATAEELSGGTALHFAACLGRKHCLVALIDAGASLDATNCEGKTPGQLVKDAVSQEIMAVAIAQGKKNLALLSKEGKFFAVRFFMRAGRAKGEDFLEKLEYRTAVDWIWMAMCSWKFSPEINDDDLTVFKIMSEIKFRYGLEASKKAPPSIIACESGTTTEAEQLKATLEILKDVKEIAKELMTAVKMLGRISDNVDYAIESQFGTSES